MEAGTTAPQPWARSPPVVALLDNILDGKTITDVDLELLLSEGGLHDEHVFQLVDLIPQVMYAPRNPDFWVYRAHIKLWQAIGHGPSDSHTHQHVYYT